MTIAPATVSPVTEYAQAVVAGDILAGRLVRLAAERHLRDLERTDVYFDPRAAEFAVNFFTFLSHSKGEWSGDRFELAPWQAFIVGSVFGWKWPDGRRRFTDAYIEVARKNGKTTLAAGVGILLAFFDDEPGAEVYAAATKRDQAKISWSEARAMVKASPGLAARISLLASNMHQEETRSKFEPLSADYNSLDGLNIHGSLIDELHAHKTADIWNVLQTARGARRQPVTFAITTAGFDRTTICWSQHTYATRMLEGAVEADTLFAFIATLDVCDEHAAGGLNIDCETGCDDWADPANWPKANPNLGVSVKLDYLKAAAAKAAELPAELNAFLQLHLDVWTTQSSRWLSDDIWNACEGDLDPAELDGLDCFAGLSVNSTTDLAALVLWFPERAAALLYCWCPEDTIDERSRADGITYDAWARAGHIQATDGNVIDFGAIRRAINELGLTYNIREIGTKRWNATALQSDLADDGFEVKQFGDGFKDMSPGTKELEKRLLETDLTHFGNPVFRWAAGNVAVRRDAEENIRPDKEASTERIDPIEAFVMALGLDLGAEDATAGVFFA